MTFLIHSCRQVATVRAHFQLDFYAKLTRRICLKRHSTLLEAHDRQQVQRLPKNSIVLRSAGFSSDAIRLGQLITRERKRLTQKREEQVGRL